MSEPMVPPGPPPVSPPPPPPPPTAGGGAGDNRGLMLVLSYVWLLALIPLLVEKDDREVQWHAKHGLVLLVAEVILWIGLAILGAIPAVGCITVALMPIALLGALIVRILCIVKAVNGQRFLIPGLSPYADKL